MAVDVTPEARAQKHDRRSNILASGIHAIDLRASKVAHSIGTICGWVFDENSSHTEGAPKLLSGTAAQKSSPRCAAAAGDSSPTGSPGKSKCGRLLRNSENIQQRVHLRRTDAIKGKTPIRVDRAINLAAVFGARQGVGNGTLCVIACMSSRAPQQQMPVSTLRVSRTGAIALAEIPCPRRSTASPLTMRSRPALQLPYTVHCSHGFAACTELRQIRDPPRFCSTMCLAAR